MPEAQISFASGPTWGIRAADRRSASVLCALAQTARLQASSVAPERILTLRDPKDGEPGDCGRTDAVCYLFDGQGGGTAVDMARVCAALAAQIPEALLIHSALVVNNGRGVLLAGPGGRGKTTTSRRLPPPWQALSDDATLVLPDTTGRHVGHPWPTWSRLMRGQSEETWDVQQSFPLDYICFLARADHDAVMPVGRGQALCLVLECVEHLRGYLPGRQVSSEKRLQDLESAARLVKSVPAGILHVSPAGPFWLALEAALDAQKAQP